jgi:cyclase
VLKKRLVFTLLFDGTGFVLSRNFRLQKVGDLSWLQRNYNFENTARSIDELIILNVSREKLSQTVFAEVIRNLTRRCFVPISAGGGICSADDAGLLLKSGADKVVVNSLIIDNYEVIQQIARRFGKQCIVASVDVKRMQNGVFAQFINSGRSQLEESPSAIIERIDNGLFGEIYLNSIDRDGTGQGYDMETLNLLPANFSKPVILAGGVGNSGHIDIGLRDKRVDAVATAHLFNFVGDGLKIARNNLETIGYCFPRWDFEFFDQNK